MLELLLMGKFIYDVILRLMKDSVFRTLGFLVFVFVLVGTLFFWLVEGMTFMHAMYYAVGSLSMNSPADGPTSHLGKGFAMIYMLIGVGVYLTFILEVGKTIIAAHHEFEKKRHEKKEAKKAAKEAKKA